MKHGGILDAKFKTNPPLCLCLEFSRQDYRIYRIGFCVLLVFCGHSPLGEAAAAAPQFRVSSMATKRHKKAQKISVCFAVENRQARHVSFSFHFYQRHGGTEACREGMAMKTRFQNQKGTATMQGTARLQ
ncbi:MAG: hypothetical protein ACOX9C_05160 [Kiritimatiellia bacterium]|jgi:hypothetical protein